MAIELADFMGEVVRDDGDMPEPIPLQAGGTLGLLSNGKWNATDLLEAVGDTLAPRFRFGARLAITKETWGKPASDEIITTLREQCLAVVTASGD